MRTDQSRIIYVLGFLVLVLLLWNILIMAGVIKTKYNTRSENMVAGPPASGVQAFDKAMDTPRQTEEEKRKLISAADRDFVRDYGSAYGGPPGSREAMKAFYAGKGIQMAAPSATPIAEHYGGSSSMGGASRNRKPRGEKMDASAAEDAKPFVGNSKKYTAASNSLPALKDVGLKPYSASGNKENATGMVKGAGNFIYTEKMQAFSNGEKYKVVTGRVCSTEPINHLTGMIIDSCQAHCSHDKQCAAFTYNFRNGDCRTFGSCKRLRPDDEEVQTFSREN